MKNTCTFYIVRHGKTVWNEKKLIQGHKDSLLTSEGEEQAKNVADELKDIHFDLAFSSDLLRAKRTAEIIALEKKLAIETTESLRERAYGTYEGHTYEALDAFEAILGSLTDSERFTHALDGVESDEQIVTRFITFLREMAVTHAGKTILLVTHADIMHKFLIHIGFGTYKTFPLSSIGNTAYVVLEADGVEFAVKETKRIERTT